MIFSTQSRYLVNLLIALFWIQSLIGNETLSGVYLGSREGDPASLVKNVSVIHGDYSEQEVDLVVSAPDPLILSRFYSSRDPSFVANLGGWRFYPQCYLKIHKDPEGRSYSNAYGTFDYTYACVGTVEGSILTYSAWRNSSQTSEITQFDIDAEDRVLGLANCARSNISSWTNLKNNVLLFHPENEKFKLLLCSGGKRHYIKSSQANCYLLAREELPNGNKVLYEYDPNLNPILITLVNVSEEKTLAWIKIEYGDSIHIEASNSHIVDYEFEKGLLSQVTHSHKPSIQYQYEVSDDYNLLKRKDLPEGRFVEIDYYLDGLRKNKVRSVTIPIDQGEAASTKFSYVDSGLTEVIGPLGRKTIYYYNDYFELRAIEDYLDEALYRTYKKNWGERGDVSNLIQSTIEDRNGNVFYAKTYSYDPKGNILEECEYGNLTGFDPKPILFDRNGSPLSNQECYTKTYKYEKVREKKRSEDIVSQVSKEGNGLRLIYHPDTPILKRKELLNRKKIEKRYFYEYDLDGALISVVVDNGPNLNYGEISEKRITKLTPKQDLPNLGAPEVIEEKYFDPHSKKEVLVKKVVNRFDSNGLIIFQDIYSSDDQFQYSLEKNYDDAGRLSLETDPTGNSVRYVYNTLGNLIEKKEEEKTTTYSYNLQNNLTSVTLSGVDDSSLSTQYKYDKSGNLVLEADHLGHGISYKYDELGRLIKVIHPPILTAEKHLTNPIETFEYDFLDHLTQVTDAQGNITSTSYNVRGDPTHIEYPDGSTEDLIYTLDGKLYRNRLPNGVTKAYEYDYLGHIQNITSYPKNSPYSNRINCDFCFYSPFNLVFKRDYDGNVQYLYDGAGRLIQSLTAEDTAQVSWSGTNSRVKKGRKVDYFYDSLGRICATKVWKDKDHFTSYKQEYNLLGLITLETIENEQSKVLFKRKYGYDELHRLEKVIGFPNNQESILETYAYDSLDRLIKVQKNGASWRIRYEDKYVDSWGQKTSRKIITDSTGLEQEETYDHRGNLLSFIKKGADQKVLSEETFSYDPLGQLSQESAAILAKGKHLGDHETSYTYNPSGFLETTAYSSNTPEKLYENFSYKQTELIKQTTSAFQKPTEYRYESNGRLFLLLYPERSQENMSRYRFSYDEKGRIKEAESNKGSVVKRSFNELNQILSETIRDNFKSYSVSFSYDKEGCLKEITLPDKSTIVYAYDGPYVRSVTRYSKDQKELYHYTVQSRDLMGHISEETLIGGIGTRKTYYDPYGRKVATESNFFTEVIPSDGFDLLGNVRKKECNINQKTYQTTLIYGPLSELLSEEGVFSHSYDYDSLENCRTKNRIPYKVNALNQLIDTQDTSLTYDLNGNLESKANALGTTTFEFDALGRLVLSKTSQGEIISNAYDHLGRRLCKQVKAQGGTKILRHFYVNRYLLGSLNEKGEIVELRIPNNPNSPEEEAIISIELKNVPYAPLTDLQDSIRCLVDLEESRVVESYNLSAFGEEEVFNFNKKISSSALQNPWRYQGQYHDEETGLIYFGNRYYDPQIGKWISPDPLETFDSLNLYSFCHNNPLRYRDYWGLFSIDKSCGCVNHGHPGYHQRPSDCVCICGQHDSQAKLSRVIYGAQDFAVITWNNPRFQGSLQAFGGLTEAVIGGGMALGSGGLMAPVGGAVMAHGLDHLFAGLQTAFSGTSRDTVTSHLLQTAGMSSQSANMIDSGISIVGSVGGIAAIRASQLAAFPNFRLPFNRMSNLNEELHQVTKLWPSASKGNQFINEIEYIPHALERMSPRGLIQSGTEIVSRGVPPSVVENAIKFGAKISGNTSNEIVHIFENVRVVTNSECTRVVTVITTGR